MSLKDDYTKFYPILWADKLDQLLSTTRNIEEIECALVFSDKRKIESFIKVMKQHGNKITCLDISHFEFEHFSEFMEILNSCPKLETFTCGTNFINGSNSNTKFTLPQVVLRKLQTLHRPTLVEYFRAPELTSLKLRWVNAVKNSDKLMVEFLKCCPKLEILEFEDLMTFEHIYPPRSYKQNRINFRRDKYPFKLNKLILNDTNGFNNLEWMKENFEYFFQLHGQDLEEFNSRCTLDESTLKMIFTKLEMVKRLKIDISKVHKRNNETFYNEFMPIYTLRSLEISPDFDRECLEAVLRNCPNLEELNIRDFYGGSTISKHCPNLKKLALFSFVELTGRFNCLEEFGVHQIDSIDALLTLLNNNLRIKTLRINAFDNKKSHITMLDAILAQTEIINLKIQCSPRKGKTVYEKLKTNYGKLHTLEVIFFDHSHQKQILYKFPQSESEAK